MNNEAGVGVWSNQAGNTVNIQSFETKIDFSNLESWHNSTIRQLFVEGGINNEAGVSVSTNQAGITVDSH